MFCHANILMLYNNTKPMYKPLEPHELYNCILFSYRNKKWADVTV